MYRVYDSTGALVRAFHTLIEALNFKYVCGNTGWYII